MERNMNAILLPIVLLLAAIMLMSCNGPVSSAPSIQNNQNNATHVKNTNPSYQQDNNAVPMRGVINETDYSNIKAYTEQDKYALDVKSIRCIITNENVGKGFYFFPAPFIEKLLENKWVRLDYQPAELSNLVSWAYCAVEGNTTKPNSTMLTFVPQYLTDGITRGSYRLVIFVGDKTIYAPFVVE
jgi:hypothetical protein